MGDHLLRQQDGWNTAAPTSSSAPMELTMELMGSKPFNPKVLAERVGFEPTLPFRVNTLSKRAPSATRPSLLRRVCCGKRRAPERARFLLFDSMAPDGQTATLQPA